jgi:hypothetical protein
MTFEVSTYWDVLGIFLFLYLPVFLLFALTENIMLKKYNVLIISWVR